MSAALVAVAHGSRDPRSAATVAELVEEVRRQRPGLDVRLSFLDLSAPRLPDVLDAVAADGHRRAVVVPLLLGHAFHASVDVPGAVTQAAARLPGLDITTSEVLGGHRGLSTAALRRLSTALVADPASRSAVLMADPASRSAVAGLHDPGLGVVLAAIGSSHAPANAAVAELVASWTRRFGWHGGSAAFATTTTPTVSQAVADLRARGARRVAVAQWILAPGLLPDRIVRDGTAVGALVADALAADPGVVLAVLDRYDDTVAGSAHRRAAS
ncbi:sirohydrochlorin ferrochelatase [Pseudonocardia hierapolitana]|uniref:Sirohydrochlorin ferrochelatase n=1 Tax=Pseudonocardia hierapolitana TaxID=1128676 RepID=A0A561SKU3_9PSEU|nr:CbiX/SirB N-terminal domain-containing protein [Pseudonocardia hierapolitana]TWF75485.1 sirohydrochlorin ferrochelatase [Pseudonocardia hierapolitana]